MAGVIKDVTQGVATSAASMPLKKTAVSFISVTKYRRNVKPQKHKPTANTACSNSRTNTGDCI
jgi:hypothetical protein